MRVCGRFQTLLRARDHTVDELRTVTVLSWERFRPGARGRFPNSPARARQLYWGWSTFAPPNLVFGFRRKANAIPQSDLKQGRELPCGLGATQTGKPSLEGLCACAGVSKLSCARATTLSMSSA